MSYRVPVSPDTLSHPDSDQRSFISFSDSDLCNQIENKMQEIDTAPAQAGNSRSSDTKVPRLLPPHLWNLPYITISPEILETASIIDPERVSRLFAESIPSTAAIPSTGPSTVPQLRSRLPVQPITPFDGKAANLRPFCSQLVNQIQGESFVTEIEKVRFAYQCLGSGALAKMRSSFRYLEDPSVPPEIVTLDQFLAALKQRCEDPSLRDQATTKVEGLYQKTMKFHDFITVFEDNMVDSIYSTVDKSHWRLMLERRLSPQLRNLILSASDVPEEYHAFVTYLRRKDAGLQEILASSKAGLLRPSNSANISASAPGTYSSPSRPESTPLSYNLPISQGGSAMDLDAVSREKNTDGRLTQQAKDARRKLGRCIRCNKSGHIVRSCPLGLDSTAISSSEVKVIDDSQELKD